MGKTSQGLARRFAVHKFDSKRYNSKVNRFLREKGPENFTMRLLEVVVGDEEAAFSENWWCIFLKAGLNSETPGLVILCGGKEEYVRRVCSRKLGCGCGGCYALKNRTEHFRTRKHQNYLLGKK